MTRPTTNRTEATDMAEEPNELAALQLRAAQLASIAKVFTQAAKDAKLALEHRMNPRDTARPVFPGTAVVAGTISYKAGGRSIAGLDSEEFRVWVDENYPGEIELVEQVRPAFRGRFVMTDDNQVVGPTGEIGIPGLHVAEASPILAVIPTKDLGAVVHSLRDVPLRELIPGE
jgi:hypothetical protein